MTTTHRPVAVKFGILLLIIGLLAARSGCSTLPDSQANQSPYQSQPTKRSASKYFDFGDIPVPAKFEVDVKHTAIVETMGMKTGSLTPKGRVDRDSLVEYFKVGMTNDNWQMLTSIKVHWKVVQLFKKQNRWCIIQIVDGTIDTTVEIWVAPRPRRWSRFC